MDKVPVQVQIHTEQRLEDGTTQNFASQAKGHLYQKGNTWYVTYRETDEEGSTTQATWKTEADQAVLIRQGVSRLRAVFQTGETDQTMLTTPYGSMPVQIHTYWLDIEISQAGGRLQVDYQIDLAGAVSRMNVELQVTAIT